MQRYRLEERLSGPDPVRGSLWRAVDVIQAGVGDLPVPARQQLPETAGDCGIPGFRLPVGRAEHPGRQLARAWPQMQMLSGWHPQSPRCGELLLALEERYGLCDCDWQDGIAYDLLLRHQQRRVHVRMSFQRCCCCAWCCRCLPLACWHPMTWGMVHGDLNARHLLRRSSDGLPVVACRVPTAG